MQTHVQSYTTRHPEAVHALDVFIRQCLGSGNVQDLIRLNTYLRRYFSPLVVRELFFEKRLPSLLEQRERNAITALILDMRGFVRTTDSGERSSEGLDVVARLLRVFFSRIIRIAFANCGMVGEIAGDRVLVTFGFPSTSLDSLLSQADTDPLTASVCYAVNTAFSIRRLSEEIKQDQSFPHSMRQFEVGIGICAGRNAWIGDIGSNQSLGDEDSWRQELTVISAGVNIAARAEELTKTEPRIAASYDNKIIVDETVVRQLQKRLDPGSFTVQDLGEVMVRGLEESVRLFHFTDLAPTALDVAQAISPADQMLVDWICGHIDGALERDTAVKIHRSLSDVGQAIVASALPDEEAVFDQIMERIISSFRARKASLYQVDQQTRALVVKNSIGPNPLPRGTTLPPDTGIAGMVARTGEVVVSDDVHTNRAWSGMRHDPTVHSMMCVPLWAGGNVVGVIQVMDDKVGTFSQTDLDALKAFAGLATVALENARIYEQSLRMARARAIITRAFSSAQTLDEVLNDVMEAVEVALVAHNGTSTHNATLYLIDRETKELEFKKIVSESTQNPPEPGERIPAHTGVVGWVVDHKEARLIRDTTQDPDWYDKIGSDMRSMICVPLVAKGRAVGAIQVLSRDVNAYDEEDCEMLTWLSASAAVAVDNAVQMKESLEKLQASEMVAHLGQMAGDLAHDLKNQIGGILAIARYQIETDDPELAGSVNEIVEAADQALQEVARVLQPVTDWQPARIDISAFLHALILEQRESLLIREKMADFKPQIELEEHFCDQPLFVYAGRDHLKSIFQNLINNAVDAIDKKGEATGKVVVRTHCQRLNTQDWIFVTIEDSGTGIPPDHLDRIFDLGFTTRPEGKPGGYGLYWVRYNIQRLGGRVTVRSVHRVGSTFEVRLPAFPEEEQDKGDERANPGS